MEFKGRSRTRQSTVLICPRDFLQSWNLEAFQATRMRKPQNEKEIHEQICNMMSVSDETVGELAEVCGKSTLYTGNEPKHFSNLLEMPQAPPEVDLECVKFQEEQRRMRREIESYKVSVNRHMKYNVMDDYMALLPQTLQQPVAEEQYQVPVPNVILTLQITKCLQQGEKSTRYRECETMMVLGSQPLSALRDKISCSADAIIPGDYSSLPDVDTSCLEKAGDIYKSSFFFIENVFYNDFRQSDNKDYSKIILKWASEHMPDAQFTTAAMEKTKFFDLKIRLGHHYLFTHQGNCEHSVLFTDIRIFSSEDVQDFRHYPILTITRLKNRSVCQSCLKFSSKWIVRDSSLIPTDPCFLCRACFKSLLYTKNGEKRSNFKAYHLSEFYSRESSTT
ncbi:snRNA-activating protein complex subunit 3 [Aplysia californica]|uniref:snRNA-activating protein complex subunit 3 n=1 Tax=Aplysia californica TaxID=6500 RepID=A0ABM0JYU9_APLCA|nr:snRNA-activating protein complex subunit 3 [Aplysia californica]